MGEPIFREDFQYLFLTRIPSDVYLDSLKCTLAFHIPRVWGQRATVWQRQPALSFTPKWILSWPSRGLLEESQFQEAVIRSLAEPTPYFCQFWSEESAKQKHSPGGTSTTPTSPEFSPKCRAEDEDAGGVQERSPTETSEAQESLSVIIRKEQFREQKETIIRWAKLRGISK